MKTFTIRITILLLSFLLIFFLYPMYGEDAGISGKNIVFILLDTSASIMNIDADKNIDYIKELIDAIRLNSMNSAYALLEFGNLTESNYVIEYKEKNAGKKITNLLKGLDPNPDKSTIRFVSKETKIYSAILDALKTLNSIQNNDVTKQLFVITDGKCSERQNSILVNEIKDQLQYINYCMIFSTNEKYKETSIEFANFVKEINKHTGGSFFAFTEVPIYPLGGVHTYNLLSPGNLPAIFCTEHNSNSCYLINDVLDTQPKLLKIDTKVPLQNPYLFTSKTDTHLMGEEPVQSRQDNSGNAISNQLYVAALQSGSPLFSDTIHADIKKIPRIHNLSMPVIGSAYDKLVLAYWQQGWLMLQLADPGFRSFNNPHSIFLDMDGILSPIRFLNEKENAFLYFEDENAIYRYYVDTTNPGQAFPIRLITFNSSKKKPVAQQFKALYHPQLDKTVIMFIDNNSLILAEADDQRNHLTLVQWKNDNFYPQFDIISYGKDNFYCAWTITENNYFYLEYCRITWQQEQKKFMKDKVMKSTSYLGMFAQPRLLVNKDKVLLFTLNDRKGTLQPYYKELN